MPDPGFDAVVSFLEDGALDGPVERVDTHAAIVLLAGGRAFKLKRPVRYSFLDFTTLAAREAALFAAGHLPFLFAIVARPQAALILAVLLTNFIPGLLFGWLFWRRGLEAAMLSHALAHCVNALIA